MIRIKSYGFKILVGLLIAACATGCSKATIGKLPVGTLTGLSAENTSKTSDPLALEQQTGYELGMKSGISGFKLIQKSEGNQEDDVQTAIRDMVEENEIVALLGGTSNEATMRAASLTNFFTVPMLIPSADGENVLPSNNLWVFRLSPPSSAYSKYLFSEVLPKSNPTSSDNSSGDSTSVQGGILKLAIIYEKNTFGENAAVAAAQTAMDQSIKIVDYESYSPGSDDSNEILTLAQNVKESGAHLVYVISSNPQDAISIASTLEDAFGNGVKPVVLGQGSGFNSQTFLDSEKINGVYIIRQGVDLKSCPKDINTITKAQTYASTFLLQEAIKQANESLSNKKLSLSLNNNKKDQITTRRERIRDIMKQIDFSVPCVGRVAFDSNGINKFLKFDLLLVNNKQSSIVTAEQFSAAVEEGISLDTLKIIE